MPHYELTFAQLGCFPNDRKPNVLWLGVSEPSRTLARLQSALSATLACLGFAPDVRPFQPHLTLARVPHGAREAAPPGAGGLGVWLDERPPPVPHTMRATAVHLMQSELSLSGARYTPLAEFKLTCA